jgi:PelA/Pel-15E family pectate lyase
MLNDVPLWLPGLAALAACAATPSPAPVAPPPAPRTTAVSLDGLADGIKHYRNRHGADYAKYAPEQIVEIAENLMLYQRANGGWIENQDPTRILDASERTRLAADQTKPEISFDNRNVFSQVEYLAAVSAQTHDSRYGDAAVRGIQAMLAHQIASCGGWPHTVPGGEPYHGHITIADDVTSGVLTLLRRVAEGAPTFIFVAPELRARAYEAVARGDACLLRLQIVQAGQLAGWAGQYDSQTLQPALGRSYELPAIVAWETTGVVRYLMGIERPPPEIVRAIEGAIAWLERSRLPGLRIETFPAEPVKYQYHTSTTDRRLVADPAAPPLWARFYDLADNSVVLANRDGKRVATYDQIARERRTGYDWYGDWPVKLLSAEVPAWRARVTRSTSRN